MADSLTNDMALQVGYEKAVQEIVDYLRNGDLEPSSISEESREALAEIIGERFKMK